MTLLAWLFVCIIWSTVWLFIKLGVTDVPPFAFAATRLLIALGILGPLVFRRRSIVRVSPRDRRLIWTSGVMLFTANYALLYWAAQYVSSGLMAVLQAITPSFALVIAQRLLPDERVTAAKAFGLLLGLAGVALIFADELRVSGALSAAACAAVVGSAFVVAWAYVLVRARGSHLPSTTLMAGQIAAGVMPLLLLSVVSEGNPLATHWTPTAVAAVVYLAVAGSVVAFWLNYWLMKRIGPTRMLLTSILEPLLAVLLGAMVLGERLTSRVALGGALVLGSVALVMRGDTRAGGANGGDGGVASDSSVIWRRGKISGCAETSEPYSTSTRRPPTRRFVRHRSSSSGSFRGSRSRLRPTRRFSRRPLTMWPRLRGG